MERKFKYDYGFKLVLEKHYLCHHISVQKGLNESNIRKWLGFINNMATLVFCQEKTKVVSVNFKTKVLKEID
jgi:hypothetical protein